MESCIRASPDDSSVWNPINYCSASVRRGAEGDEANLGFALVAGRLPAMMTGMSATSPWRHSLPGPRRPARLSLAVFVLRAAVLLGMCSVAARQGISASEEPASAPPAGAHLQVPDHGAYTGAYIDFGETEDHVTRKRLNTFTEMVGKHQAIIASSSYWGQQSFPRRNLEEIEAYGAVALVYWSPWDKPYDLKAGPDRFALPRILRGDWDAYVDRWADQAKAYGKPFMVAWGLEMNGSWFPWSGCYYGEGGPAGGPELYKQAYRYVVDRVRARGVTNILWVFHVNNVSDPSGDWNRMAKYYPGDGYVDWLGMSAYGKQFADDPWVTAHEAFARPYEELAALHPDKPMMMAEWGIGEFPQSGDKAAWIREAFRELSHDYPRFKAAVFWHERWENGDGTFSNLRANSSPGALAAYRQGVSNPYWLAYPVWAGPGEGVREPVAPQDSSAASP